MTDEELIARLRQHDGWVTLEAHTHLTAADRIEALTKERDEARAAWELEAATVKLFVERHQRHLILGAETRTRAEQLEAKLAKAVEALRQIADPISLAQGNVNAEIARATLEEIKGDSHE